MAVDEAGIVFLADHKRCRSMEALNPGNGKRSDTSGVPNLLPLIPDATLTTCNHYTKQIRASLT